MSARRPAPGPVGPLEDGAATVGHLAFNSAG